jgi:putative transposase
MNLTSSVARVPCLQKLWSTSIIQQNLDYTHMNPVEAGIVERPEEYLFSSAGDFNETKGLLNLESL